MGGLGECSNPASKTPASRTQNTYCWFALKIPTAGLKKQNYTIEGLNALLSDDG